jgi:hypothetical protein
MKPIPFNWQVFNPNNGAAVGNSALAFYMPFNATLVHAVVSPFVDDTGATLDIQDDTVDVATAIDASDHDVPGEWATTHTGGTNAPVYFAAGSLVELDFNNAANGNRFDVTLWFAPGVVWA